MVINIHSLNLVIVTYAINAQTDSKTVENWIRWSEFYAITDELTNGDASLVLNEADLNIKVNSCPRSRALSITYLIRATRLRQ